MQGLRAECKGLSSEHNDLSTGCKDFRNKFAEKYCNYAFPVSTTNTSAVNDRNRIILQRLYILLQEHFKWLQGHGYKIQVDRWKGPEYRMVGLQYCRVWNRAYNVLIDYQRSLRYLWKTVEGKCVLAVARRGGGWLPWLAGSWAETPSAPQPRLNTTDYTHL